MSVCSISTSSKKGCFTELRRVELEASILGGVDRTDK